MTILQTYLQSNRCVEQEHQNVPLRILEGAVPSELRGTLFRNGNGRFEHQGVLYKHLFDGDGMISAFNFEDGAIRYRNRYVRTREFVEEEDAGRMLYRSFGTNLPGGFLRNFMRMRFKNAANTSVVFQGGKLLALWEGGLPHRIDPKTLETIERYDYGGVLQNNFSTIDRLIMPELPFSAHPRRHPASGVLYNFGTLAGKEQRLILYQVDPEGRAEITHVLPMEELYFTHDFTITEGGQQIFFLIPVAFDILRAFLGLKPPVDAMLRRPSLPIKILVIDGEDVQEYETDYCFIFHFANAYRDESGSLIIDAWKMPDFPATLDMRKGFTGEAEDAPKAVLTRYRLEPGQKEAQQELLSDFLGEFPIIHPQRTGRPHRYIWGIGDPPDTNRALTHGFIKVDTEQNCTDYLDLYPMLPGEPLFVPRPDAEKEDDGWLLPLIFDPETASTLLYIIDASTLEVLTKARLPHNIPLGFHGCWVELVH